MPEDDPKRDTIAPTTSNQPGPEQPKLTLGGEVPSPETPEATPTTQALDSTTDRFELLSRARTFLTSPQIQDQDVFAKRRFLVDKGLNESEVEGLLQELVRRQTICFLYSDLASVSSLCQGRRFHHELTRNLRPPTSPTCSWVWLGCFHG